MLKTVVAAQLPLVAVFTRDTLNLPDVIKELTGVAAVRVEGDKISIQEDKLHFLVIPRGTKVTPDLDGVYEKLMKKHATLLIVNPPTVTDAMFNAGEIPVPRPLMLEFLKTVTGSESKAAELARALGGVTLKEAAELSRLTMARDASLTPSGVVLTRKEFFAGSNGLTIVDPSQPYYEPNKELANWIVHEKPFFLGGTDHRLIPRGLLMDGPPGTGKTEGAKHIATQFGVPLYRMDIGSTKEMYVGNSQSNLRGNLARLDNEEPCIALFDEIEKSFAQGEGHGDASTTTDMLSQLLWWLAEHRSRVLSIMTTNNAKKLPPELWRARRIDKKMEFTGLDKDQARPFVDNVLKTFKRKIAKGEFDSWFGNLFIGGHAVSQAALTERAYELVKQSKA